MSPDWELVRRRVAARPWAAAIARQLADDFDRWRRDLVIPPPGPPSAWTHHYFCDTDGEPLRFDASVPDRHVCTGCGRLYRGEPWDGAWRTKMHNAAAAQAQRAALLARLGRPGAAAELARIVAAYARDYTRYEPHGANAGTGRVQPQSLDEAIWAIGMLRAVRWAADELSPNTHAAVDGMAEAIISLLRPQVGQIHNIHCWMLAALAWCAARLGDAETPAWCRDSEFGARAQVMRGFHPEGLWYEISPAYHYYTVAALLSYREAAGAGGLPEAAVRRLASAINAPPALAYPDGRLPAYADAWPSCWVADFAPQAEAAWAILPEEPIDLGLYYAWPRPAPVRLWYGSQEPLDRPRPLPGRSSVAALVFGPEEVTPQSPPGGSLVWPEAGIGVLRSPRVRLALRFGPDGGGHDHRDKLNVDVAAGGWASLDLGTSGYGAAFTDWMRSPYAHNLLIVGGRPQPPHTGGLLEHSPRRLRAESAWGGHVIRRAVALTAEGWTDECDAELAAPSLVEWVFHGDGLFAPGEGEPAELDLPWLREVRRLQVPRDRVLTGSWDDEHGVRVAVTVPEGFAAYAARADGNPTGRPLGLLLLRGRAGRVRVHAAFALDG
ncbi:heparinase II/III domain-containing protein [Thermoactinospora rubra]|uniref:heparinase II/III domain-containing protein n=1 Tax=Thermoactinospora rubra TaxID=1088767 RepID=UPI000A104DE2|nr:heparinase II/III family protein [Thermoactinospora rubra]